MIENDCPQQSHTELKSSVLQNKKHMSHFASRLISDTQAYLGFTLGFRSEPHLKFVVQHGDLLDGGFLGRNTSHLEFQPSDILARPGGNHGLGELEIVLSGKYVGDDVWSIKDDPLGGAWSTRAEVDANDANVFAGKSFTAERAGGGETGRSFGDDLLATT